MNPFAARLVRSLGGLLVGLLALSGSQQSMASAVRAPPVAPTSTEAALLATLAANLRGSLVLTPAAREAPPGWRSTNPGALRVLARGAGGDFSLWLLPPRWVGLRAEGPVDVADAGSTLYRGAAATVVLERPSEPLWRALGAAELSTASLLNGGQATTARVFAGRFAEAEAEARGLLARECRDDACRARATASLLLLGVPAPGLYEECALRPSEDRALCVYALARFPGSAAVAALARVLEDASASGEVLRAAAFGASLLHDGSLGPALHRALLRGSLGLDEQSLLVRALARLRYAPAGPRMLALFSDATVNPHYRAELAEALASLRYAPATPALRAFAEGPFPQGSWRFPEAAQGEIRERTRRALAVLTGSWGAPAGGLRLLLQGPAASVVGAALELSVLAENVGEGSLERPAVLWGSWVVDGVVRSELTYLYDGPCCMEPGELESFARDVGPWLATPGAHTVEYSTLGARSNALTVTVRARR